MFVQISGETILEYCSTLWLVLLKKVASKIEKVQRRATRMVKNNKDFSYTERLRKLGLNTNKSRGHKYKIFKKQCRTKYVK